MKKIALTFVILLVGLTTYSQNITKISPDGELQADYHYSRKKGIEPRIEIFQRTEGGWERTLNIKKYVVEDYNIFNIHFSHDSKKLYFCSSAITYEYDIEKGKYKKMFKDSDVSVMMKAIDGDTLLLRETLKRDNGDIEQQSKFYKYIDGQYISFVPKAYFDYLKGGFYLDGKKCVSNSDEFYLAEKLLTNL